MSTSSTPITPSIRGRDETHNWVSCPVNPAWILEGSPVARIEHLSSSADGTASTYFWDCTAGRFNWFYTFDETLHILEGSMTLKFPDGRSQYVSAGDIVFFPNGSRAEWTVDKYVRKLAFCRTALPGFLVSARDAVRRVRRFGRPAAAGRAGRRRRRGRHVLERLTRRARSALFTLSPVPPRRRLRVTIVCSCRQFELLLAIERRD